MPETNDNEVVAVFRADIEQFKKDVNEANKATGKLGATVDETGQSTKKFAGHSKSAASSVSTLSRGLGGITGLLGITGRLFGVNTDKLEGFIFASREFIKVAKDVQHAQHLSNLATKEGTAAKAANETATVSLTIAERALNAVRAAGALGIGLIVAGIVALGAAIVSYIGNLKEEEKQQKRNQELDKERIKLNNELTESFNKRIEAEEKRVLSEAVSTGKISERGAKEEQARLKNLDRLSEIEKETISARIEAMKSGTDQFGRLQEREEAIIQANRKKKMESAEADYQQALLDIKTEFDNKDREKKKQEDIKTSEENERIRLKLLEEEGEFFTRLENERIASIKAGQAELNKANEQAGREAIESFKRGFNGDPITGEGALSLKDDSEILNENGLTQAQQEKVDKDAEKRRQERIDNEKQMLDTLFNAQQQAFDKRQQLLEEEQTLQEKNIDIQRDLAARGLENTLAFEQKRQAELQRQQQKEAQTQKRVKLLETFLNSLAEFSKTDPKTALQKALLQVALATAATAVFAEEGGIIGEIGHTSNLRRRHRGGGDVLLHAQTGEGILSRREMDNLGKRNFHLLKDVARFPIRDDIFNMPKIAIAGGMAISNAEVVNELKALRNDIKNQKRESWEVNKFGDYIKTSIENGVTEVTKGKLPKPRFRG